MTWEPLVEAIIYLTTAAHDHFCQHSHFSNYGCNWFDSTWDKPSLDKQIWTQKVCVFFDQIGFELTLIEQENS